MAPSATGVGRSCLDDGERDRNINVCPSFPFQCSMSSLRPTEEFAESCCVTSPYHTSPLTTVFSGASWLTERQTTPLRINLCNRCASPAA